MFVRFLKENILGFVFLKLVFVLGIFGVYLEFVIGVFRVRF